VLSTLYIIEAILAPIALLSLFIAATIIGRRAATPIERMRVQQLEFTADASHELRTPLSVIEAEVSLALSADRSADAYRGSLERISQESRRLRGIVNDLLWLARLDALPLEPTDEAVDLAEIALGCRDRFSVVASQREITLEVMLTDGPPPVIIGPAEWLDRLLSVLLDNACRYSRHGGHISVTVNPEVENVSMLVDDDGPGFNEVDRVNLLQRFHRASELPGGAGLGLAIAAAVVRATNGTLTLGSSPVGGARVTVTWPRALTTNAVPSRLHRRGGTEEQRQPESISE
jgi:signal transduction histidine kinase